MKKLRIEEDKLNLEQENSNGEFMKMNPLIDLFGYPNIPVV